MDKITKRAVKAAFNISSDAALARLFKVTQPAAAKWEDDKAIPELRQLQLLRDYPAQYAEILATP